MKISLLEPDPCPVEFRNIEALCLSLRELRKKFEVILTSEGFSMSELKAADLMFVPAPNHRDDFCSTCRATLALNRGEPVECIVDHVGQRLDAQPGAPGDAR